MNQAQFLVNASELTESIKAAHSFCSTKFTSTAFLRSTPSGWAGHLGSTPWHLQPLWNCVLGDYALDKFLFQEPGNEPPHPAIFTIPHFTGFAALPPTLRRRSLITLHTNWRGFSRALLADSFVKRSLGQQACMPQSPCTSAHGWCQDGWQQAHMAQPCCPWLVSTGRLASLLASIDAQCMNTSMRR